MNTIKTSTVVDQKKHAIPIVLAVALVMGFSPKSAKADSAEAVAAVLVGAALLYAVKDSDGHKRHRSQVGYHYHNGGRQRCYDHHVAHRGNYYQHNRDNNHQYGGHGRAHQSNNGHYAAKAYRGYSSNDYRDRGHKGKAYKHNGHKDRGHKDKRRQWNTRVPIH